MRVDDGCQNGNPEQHNLEKRSKWLAQPEEDEGPERVEGELDGKHPLGAPVLPYQVERDAHQGIEESPHRAEQPIGGAEGRLA